MPTKFDQYFQTELDIVVRAKKLLKGHGDINYQDSNGETCVMNLMVHNDQPNQYKTKLIDRLIDIIFISYN